MWGLSLQNANREGVNFWLEHNKEAKKGKILSDSGTQGIKPGNDGTSARCDWDRQKKICAASQTSKKIGDGLKRLSGVTQEEYNNCTA